jgi:hypothetical protein
MQERISEPIDLGVHVRSNRGRTLIIWHLVTNDEMYQDETGYEKGETQKRKIVETETFSVDERIRIISGIIAVVGKEEGEST